MEAHHNADVGACGNGRMLGAMSVMRVMRAIS